MDVGHHGNTKGLMDHPAAQYMYMYVHVCTCKYTDNQIVATHCLFITILIVVGATGNLDKRSEYYKYGEEHCCCF